VCSLPRPPPSASPPHPPPCLYRPAFLHLIRYDAAVRLLPRGSAARVDAQLCLADALTVHGALDMAEVRVTI